MGATGLGLVLFLISASVAFSARGHLRFGFICYLRSAICYFPP
jgi:hypothetical protein